MNRSDYVKYSNLFKKYYGDKFGNKEEMKMWRHHTSCLSSLIR